MKILLINPTAINTAVISTGWDLDISMIGRFPPYGLMTLAAYVRRERTHDIRIIDCIAEQLDYKGLKDRLCAWPADVVGITAFTYTFYDVLMTARLVREVLPQALICIGGPHVQLFPKETMGHPEFDFLISGEGEETFIKLLDALERNESEFPAIDGLSCRSEGAVIYSQTVPYIENLDGLPMPSFDLVPAHLYRSTFGSPGMMACIATSRGCPYRCTYCQGLVKKFRMHSTSKVLAMLRSMYERGYRNFYFFDDLFNITAERVIEISQGILSEGMKFNWVFRGRVNTVTPEMFRIAAQAGCSQVLVGVEDYTDEGLRAIKKAISLEQVFKCVEWAHSCGIEVSTNWIIGLPGHKSVADVRELVRVSIDSRADYAQYTILQLLPGCEMFEDAVRDGTLQRDAWSQFVQSPRPSYHIKPYDKYLSIDELSKLYRECHSRFYRRPSYLIRQVCKLRSPSDLFQKLRTGLKVLGLR